MSGMPADRRTKAELQSENTKLHAQLATLSRLDYVREIENLRSQLAALQAIQPPPAYIALKAVNGHGFCANTLKRWGRQGLIDTKREGSRWFCLQSSVDLFVARLKGL
jgi:hypothetical protein